jgi:phage anti-repressor protein
MDLNDVVVFSLIQSRELFPVDLENAIDWWDARTKAGELVRKSDLKDKLTANFDRDIDYKIDNDSNCPGGFAEISAKPYGGRPRETISLTVECFKMMGMMIAGERGNQIRRYFIRCESELKKRIEQEHETRKHRVLSAVVSPSHHAWAKRYEDEFFEEAYRITGWRKPQKGHPACMGRFINENVYGLFPEGTNERLKKVNPRNHNGNRSRKHHQHLTQPVGVSLLDYQKGVTIAVMRLSPSNSPQSFKRNMHKACNGPIQLTLPYLDDIDAS